VQGLEGIVTDLLLDFGPDLLQPSALDFAQARKIAVCEGVLEGDASGLADRGAAGVVGEFGGQDR
jgi:hypothetical protein